MQKKSLFADAAPWLVWTTLFITLAIVGHGKNGPTPAMNPRSMTAVTQPPPAVPDCRSAGIR